MLSNLASVTDATFHVLPYETKDHFTTSYRPQDPIRRGPKSAGPTVHAVPKIGSPLTEGESPVRGRIVQVTKDASAFWAAQLLRQLMAALGSSDMFGNPLGLVRRIQATGHQVSKHAIEGVRTRKAEAFGKIVIELLHGVIGGSADSL